MYNHSNFFGSNSNSNSNNFFSLYDDGTHDRQLDNSPFPYQYPSPPPSPPAPALPEEEVQQSDHLNAHPALLDTQTRLELLRSDEDKNYVSDLINENKSTLSDESLSLSFMVINANSLMKVGGSGNHLGLSPLVSNLNLKLRNEINRHDVTFISDSRLRPGDFSILQSIFPIILSLVEAYQVT